MGLSHESFEHELESIKSEKGVTEDTELTADDLKELVARFKGVYEKYGECNFRSAGFCLHPDDGIFYPAGQSHKSMADPNESDSSS